MGMVVDCADGLESLDKNVFAGSAPIMANSTITFEGSNNVLYCENGVSLKGCKIRFNGSNGLIVLGKNKHVYNIDVTVNNDCSMVFGRDVYFNGVLHAIASEQCTIALGDGCLVSFGVWIRTADPHLVYDAHTGKRINPSNHVVVGDHVWLGQGAMLLKGTRIGSGSIVGAQSVVAGKRIGSNSSWAGNPAKFLRKGIFWDGACVHTWTKKQTAAHQQMDGVDYCFCVDEGTLGDRFIASCDLPAEKRLEHYLSCGYGNGAHNRLALDATPARRGKGLARVLNVIRH